MKNKKGLILLLIIIIVILIVIIALSSTKMIGDSKKDTFVSTAKKYIKEIKTALENDTISCNDVPGSFTHDGTYYFTIDTTTKATKALMKDDGKSPYGNAEMKGYVKWVKETDNTDPLNPKVTINYKIRLEDTAGHGFDKELSEKDLKSSAIKEDLAKTIKTKPSDAIACTIE